MNISSTVSTIAAGVVLAGIVAGGAVWAFDIEQRVAGNTQTGAVLKWNLLLTRYQQNGGLSPTDQALFCALGRELNLKTPGCR